MKFTPSSALAVAAATLPSLSSAYIQGFDISNYQPNVNFQGAYNSGARFVIIKATEGTDYIDPTFSDHYDGATKAGLIRGAYHFAQPAQSSGAAQAQYFHTHGGGWSGDGITLPGMLDIEYGPSGSECYGLSASAMVSWIADFVDTYHSLTTRWPIIYTTADWWNTCTGNSHQFSSTCPLNQANYNPSISSYPGGWPYETIWQYADSYTYGGDADRFNGDMTSLKKLATG